MKKSVLFLSQLRTGGGDINKWIDGYCAFSPQPLSIPKTFRNVSESPCTAYYRDMCNIEMCVASSNIKDNNIMTASCHINILFYFLLCRFIFFDWLFSFFIFIFIYILEIGWWYLHLIGWIDQFLNHIIQNTTLCY